MCTSCLAYYGEYIRKNLRSLYLIKGEISWRIKRYYYGMSGGVDSSVSALLLKKQGYDVIGTTLELFAGSSCCNMNTYIDAKNVCKALGIPHFTHDYKEEFKKNVIDDFINSYSNCKTPNPCIECNRYMKFGIMYEKAKELRL